MRYLSLLVVLLLLTGCPPDDPAIVEDPDLENDLDEVEEVEFSATLHGQEGFEEVSGSSSAHIEAGQTHVTTSIFGAEADATHPWHIHDGTCATGGPITGDMGAYPVLEVGAGGDASANATINVALDAGASYHVNVHASPEDLGTIVACGDLQAN